MRQIATSPQLLQDRGVEPEIVEYPKAPPDAALLARILGLLGLAPSDIRRRKEPTYRELGLDKPGLGRAELIAAMTENPILTERPIVLADSQAALGRPPEDVLGIL